MQRCFCSEDVIYVRPLFSGSPSRSYPFLHEDGSTASFARMKTEKRAAIDIKEARDEMGVIRSDKGRIPKDGQIRAERQEIQTFRRDTVHLSHCFSYRGRNSIFILPAMPSSIFHLLNLS